MCGIFAIVHREGRGSTPPSVVERALDSLQHRGPDSWGVSDIPLGTGASGYLAHKRLSIIDLAGGKQPMEDETAGLILTFNGEIYNYKSLRDELAGDGFVFKEQSDTEVVLKAYQKWGENCVEHFRGMFAFAIWDSRKRELFAARDHFGKKPLFYVEHRGSVYLASEIKALLEIPGLDFSMDYSAIRNYLVYRYVPGPGTFVREVQKLDPGSAMTWRDGDIAISRYFSPPDSLPTDTVSDTRETIAAFWDVMDEAVELRMQADVPFGAFLSGGIDSSAVVALMSRHSQQRVKTFSVGFRENEYSELGYARVIADFFDTDHHELVVSHEDLIDLLPTVVRMRDAPVSEPSDIAIYLLSKAASETVKMVLTGEGSDEILAGYPKHVYERFARPFSRIPAPIRKQVFEPLVRGLPYRFRRAKTAMRNLSTGEFNERMPGWFGAVNLEQAGELLALGSQRNLPEVNGSASGDYLKNILLFDQQSWLPDNLLERGDRMTMAASIEARMPFMDVELARFAAAMPNKFRIRGGTTKWVLRQAMSDVLPQRILQRPKVGFRIPVNEWFRHGMKEQLREHLLGADSLSRAMYRENTVKKVVEEHLSGRQNHEKLLWTMLNLEIWMREYKTRVSM